MQMYIQMPGNLLQQHFTTDKNESKFGLPIRRFVIV